MMDRTCHRTLALRGRHSYLDRVGWKYSKKSHTKLRETNTCSSRPAVTIQLDGWFDFKIAYIYIHTCIIYIYIPRVPMTSIFDYFWMVNPAKQGPKFLIKTAGPHLGFFWVYNAISSVLTVQKGHKQRNRNKTSDIHKTFWCSALSTPPLLCSSPHHPTTPPPHHPTHPTHPSSHQAAVFIDPWNFPFHDRIARPLMQIGFWSMVKMSINGPGGITSAWNQRVEILLMDKILHH